MYCCFTKVSAKSTGKETSDCQFRGESAFVDVDGKNYCKFHVPMVDEVGNPTAKAAWKLSDHKLFFRDLREFYEDGKARNQRTHLSGVVFPIGFKSTIISQLGNGITGISFNRCNFIGKAVFEKAIFAELVSFADAVFEEEANFRHATFISQADYSGADFKARADFTFVEFKENAKFEKALFSHPALFESVAFGSWTFFSNARFRGACGFDYSAFNNGTFFDGATFEGRTSFLVRTEQNRTWNATRKNAPGENTNDREDRYFPQIDFNGAVFRDYIDFSNRHFLENTNFSDVVFEKAPQFHNCVLHQDTDFAGAQFKDTQSNHAARAYRTLKLAMGDVRARNEEAMFYAREQDALRRRKDTPWSIKVMSWTYMVLSDYGRNYVRPLLLLLILTGVFTFTYLIWNAYLGGPPTPSGTFAFTLRQIVRPFYVWTSTGLSNAELANIVASWPLAIRLVATVQSLMTIALIALFLLALRRQFRLH